MLRFAWRVIPILLCADATRTRRDKRIAVEVGFDDDARCQLRPRISARNRSAHLRIGDMDQHLPRPWHWRFWIRLRWFRGNRSRRHHRHNTRGAAAGIGDDAVDEHLYPNRELAHSREAVMMVSIADRIRRLSNPLSILILPADMCRIALRH